MAEKLFYTMGEVTEMFDVNSSLLRYWERQFKQLQPKRNNKGNRLYRPEDVEFIKLLYHLLKERGMTIDGARKSLQERSADDLSRESELFERLQYIRQLLVEVRETLMDDPDKTMAEDDAEAENEIENRFDNRSGNRSENRAESRAENRSESKPENKPESRSESKPAENTPEPQPASDAPAGDAPLGLVVEPEKPLPAPPPTPEPDYSSMPALVRPTEPEPEVIVVTEADLTGEPPRTDAPADASAESSDLPELKKRRRGRKEDAEPEKELFAFYEQSLF